MNRPAGTWLGTCAIRDMMAQSVSGWHNACPSDSRSLFHTDNSIGGNKLRLEPESERHATLDCKRKVEPLHEVRHVWICERKLRRRARSRAATPTAALVRSPFLVRGIDRIEEKAVGQSCD